MFKWLKWFSSPFYVNVVFIQDTNTSTSPMGSGEMEQFVSIGCYVFFNSSISAVCANPSFIHTKHIKIIINNIIFDKGGLVFSRLTVQKTDLAGLHGLTVEVTVSDISGITSCRIIIWGSKPIFSWSRNQIISLGSMPDHYYVCKKGWKTLKIQDGRPFQTVFR